MSRVSGAHPIGSASKRLSTELHCRDRHLPHSSTPILPPDSALRFGCVRASTSIHENRKLAAEKRPPVRLRLAWGRNVARDRDTDNRLTGVGWGPGQRLGTRSTRPSGPCRGR